MSGAKEQLHIYEVVVKTIGSDFGKLDNLCFDYPFACDSLAYYWAQDIPRIEKDCVPPLVSNVKFTSNLSETSSAFDHNNAEEFIDSPIFKSLLL